MKKIGFTKVAHPYGWMGNMAPYEIEYNDQVYRTAEALFQAMRFNDNAIIEAIRQERSPMGAKFKANKNKALMVVEPMSEEDLNNMRICVSLKFEQNSVIKNKLMGTGDDYIYEDVSARRNSPRSLFWGAYFENGEMIGENNLGIILMELRAQFNTP